MTLAYGSLIAELLRRVPELSDPYEDLVHQFGGDEEGRLPVGPHVVFGVLVVPLIIESLERDTDSSGLLTRIFNFLEEMAVSGDDEVKNVLMVTVLEGLGDDGRARAREMMGDATRLLSVEVERWLRPKKPWSRRGGN